MLVGEPYIPKVFACYLHVSGLHFWVGTVTFYMQARGALNKKQFSGYGFRKNKQELKITIPHSTDVYIIILFPLQVRQNHVTFRVG